MLPRRLCTPYHHTNPYTAHLARLRLRSEQEEEEEGRIVSWAVHRYGAGRRLAGLLHPHGAPPDREVHDVRDEHGGVHGGAVQARRRAARRHIHSMEGAGEGEQGVLRQVQAVESRKGPKKQH